MHDSGKDQAEPLGLSPEQIQELRTSAERFSTITNLSPDIISIIGAKGELLFNSSAALHIHGFTNEEMVGRNTMDFVHPDDREGIGAAIADITQRPGGQTVVQYRYLHKSGHYTWMEAHGYNQLDNPAVRGIITISRDITARKQIEEDLRDALAVRDEFLSIASHELKTPLTFLKAQLSLLERKIVSADKNEIDRGYFAKALKLSMQQVDRLINLVKDLLDTSRIREGKLLLDLHDSDLSEMISAAVNHFRMQLGPDAVAGEIEPGIRGVWDIDRLSQVIGNLVGNAMKHATGSPILVALRKTGTTVTLQVRDQGPGIQTEYLPTIFDRFERAGSTRDISGLGLGLFISKCIVEAHRGRIWVESAPGKGTTFFVELPTDLSPGITLPLTWKS